MSTYVGIDVAKNSVSGWTTGAAQAMSFRTDAAGRRQCCTWVGRLENAHVVMEATGGYEQRLLADLVGAGIAVSVINPRHARDFARALGCLSKTDAIDARILAQFGEKLEPKPNGLERVQSEPLRRLAARRRQLVQLAVQEKNRLEQAAPLIRRSINAVLRCLQTQLEQIDQEIERLLEKDSALAQAREHLCSVPGIGHNTAAQLLAFMPELGHATRREIAALAGLAPRNRDSGTFRGKRMIGGGRAIVRQILYMPTLVATRYNPLIRSYYRRLVEKGKSKKIALTAAMRKLLTILNTLLAKQQNWNFTLDNS